MNTSTDNKTEKSTFDIMSAIDRASRENTFSITENGALGFANTLSPFTDFFYNISSMRSWNNDKIIDAFSDCLAKDKITALKLAFFVRDIRGGLGERKTFRTILKSLDFKTFCKVAPLVPEYGRWDDLLSVITARKCCEISERDRFIINLFKQQLTEDAKIVSEYQQTGKKNPISLLAKWLPSCRKVSKDKMALARTIRNVWGISEELYRKTLSELRNYIDIVETKMCSNNWSSIDYETVPSRANLIYKNAFLKHDMERRSEFINNVNSGKAKINSSTLFPYEICAKYRETLRNSDNFYDADLEALWNNLPVPKGMCKNAIVVRDGSGSMMANVNGTSATALDVATSLAILLSQNLEEPFKDKFITFSNKPRFIDLSGYTTLGDKLNRAFKEAECLNTNIGKTMNLILQVAVTNDLKQEEIPTVIIISDMEFDIATTDFYNSKYFEKARAPFAKIRNEWENHGYKLPNICFWNVCSRTSTVPMQKNELGINLISGFSQSVFDMLMSGTSPLESLLKKLNCQRYDAVENALS